MPRYTPKRYHRGIQPDAHRTDTVAERYARPLTRILGACAAGYALMSPIATSSLDTYQWLQDSRDANPELSQRVDTKLTGFFGEDLDIVCDDFTPQYDDESGMTWYDVAHVKTYEVPVVKTHFSSERIHASPSLCALIDRSPLDVDRLSQKDIFALQAVAHEIQHTKGTADEAIAECNSINTILDQLAAKGLPTDAVRAQLIQGNAQRPAKYHIPTTCAIPPR